MDFGRFKQQLAEKEHELVSGISRLEGEARESREAEVEDIIDEATSSEGKSATFQESSQAWQTLVQVREALRRIDQGTFGACVDCGRPIELARLQAIPWTPYCREDGEKHDRELPASSDSTL